MVLVSGGFKLFQNGFRHGFWRQVTVGDWFQTRFQTGFRQVSISDWFQTGFRWVSEFFQRRFQSDCFRLVSDTLSDWFQFQLVSGWVQTGFRHGFRLVSLCVKAALCKRVCVKIALFKSFCVYRLLCVNISVCKS